MVGLSHMKMMEDEAGAPLHGPFGMTKCKSVYIQAMEGNLMLINYSQTEGWKNDVLVEVKGQLGP